MRENAILISANLNGEPHFEQLMEELENLVHACDMTCTSHYTQNLKNVNAATYIGEGKVDEVRLAAEALKADVVVFNHELSPKQQRNLENILQVPVLDRTALILEIFSLRAKTREAKLQVELAEMQYLLPRLAGSYTSLGRQRGGKNKGTGEKKIELDKRRAEEKIHELKMALEGIQSERTTQRKRRRDSDEKTIALVGYTNAGKSTLLNAFIQGQKGHFDKMVFEKDMLFATLDTSVRKVTLPNRRKVIMSDTVGFVSHLPHGLVKAFGSTLEEVRDADLLLHVIDVSNPDYALQMKVTEETLKEIGALDVPRINVYNKADRIEKEIPCRVNEGIYVSAKKGIGLDFIAKEVSDILFQDEIHCILHVPFTEGALVSYLNENAFVSESSHDEAGTRLNLSCSPAVFDKVKAYAILEVQAE